MQRNVRSISDHPLLLARQRRQKLAVIKGIVDTLADPSAPPWGPRPTYAMLAASASCVSASILGAAAKLLLLGSPGAVSGIADGVVLAATVGAGLYFLLNPKIPRTWQQQREARLSRALCDYLPADAQAYRDMQQELASADKLQPDIIARWLDRERAGAAEKLDSPAWRAVLERRV